MADIDDIKKLLKSKNLIIGTQRTLRYAKTGKLSKIYVSSNCPKNVKEDLKYYSELSETPLAELEQTNEEIGILCKKPFFISVLSVKKEEDKRMKTLDYKR